MWLEVLYLCFLPDFVGYCTFAFFLTLWLRPRILSFLTRFEEFLIPFIDDFVDGDRDELLLCPIRALHKYLSRTEQYCSGIEGLFASTGRHKKQVSCNTISFCLCWVITLALTSAPEEDCRCLRVRAREVRKVATSLLFKSNYVVHQVLKAGTWSAQSTFSLRDVTHRIRFPVALWWWLSRSCNPLTLLAPVVFRGGCICSSRIPISFTLWCVFLCFLHSILLS